MVAGHLAPQRLDDLRTRCLDPLARQGGELLRLGLAGDDRTEDRPPALPHDVAEHGAELEVGVLQDLVDPLDMRCALTDELLACPRQHPQLLDRRRRHEAAADQAVREQVGNPRGVVDVGLTSGHVLHMHGVREHQLELAIEDVPDRPPVHAGGLHRHMGHVERRQPLRQQQQLAGRRAERSNLLRRPRFGSGSDARARHHGVAMHIQAGAPRIQHVHRVLLSMRTPAQSPRRRNLVSAFRPSGLTQ